MKKVLAVAALLGVATVADAAPVAATLVSVATYSPNGASVFNRTLDTSTWTFDAATGTAAQTGGTYSGLVKVGATPLYRTTMTGATLSSGPAVAATWACLEGGFGSIVGASICGNYNFGPNLENESTYTPTVVGATVTQGGDDGIIGPPQTLANSFSAMTVFALAGAPVGFQRYCLSNTNATDLAERCATPASVPPTSGYDFVFEAPQPAEAVDDGPIAVTEGVATVIPVGANDTGFTDPSTVDIVVGGEPQKGTITSVSPPGPPAGMTVTYTASIGQLGADSFVYRLTDTAPFTDTATVTINICAAGADTTPTPFSFTAPDSDSVPLNTVITSTPVIIAGIDALAPISVAGGEYAIGAGAFTAVAGQVCAGQTVTVRQTSAATPGAATTATVTIGGVAGTFEVTTVTTDTTPDPFTFTPQTGVALTTQITSNAITVAGIDAPAAISVSAGGQYNIDGGTFTTTAGTVSVGQRVTVRQTSSATPLTATTATVTIGGVAGDFIVTTGEAVEEPLVLPGGSGALDPWSLAFLGGLPLLRRRRRQP